MAWYDRFLGIQREDKLNPSQYVISRNEGMTVDSREPTISYRNAYEQLEIVNRAVNMIVDDVAEIPYTILPIELSVRKTFSSAKCFSSSFKYSTSSPLDIYDPRDSLMFSGCADSPISSV